MQSSLKLKVYCLRAVHIGDLMDIAFMLMHIGDLLMLDIAFVLMHIGDLLILDIAFMLSISAMVMFILIDTSLILRSMSLILLSVFLMGTFIILLSVPLILGRFGCGFLFVGSHPFGTLTLTH